MEMKGMNRIMDPRQAGVLESYQAEKRNWWTGYSEEDIITEIFEPEFQRYVDSIVADALNLGRETV